MLNTHERTRKNEFYTLGLIWADGHLNWQRVELTGTQEDLKPLEHILKLTLPKIYDRQRKNWKPSRVHYNYSKSLRERLTILGYADKTKSPNFFGPKEDELRYFIKGFFDGDGSINISKGNKNRQLNFSGNYEQDWNFIETIFKQLEIRYSISRNISKKGHKSSMIRTCGRDNIQKFFSYLYPEGYDIGFIRKFDKFKEVLK